MVRMMLSASASTTRALAAAAIFAVMVSGMYANTWRSPFIYDDHVDILLNPHIRLKTLSLDSLRDAAFESNCRNRPVANISFALNYYVHEYRVHGYRLVNMLIHWLNGVAVFWLFYLTLALAFHGDRAPPESHDIRTRREMSRAEIAFWGSLVWLANPLHTNAVTYVVQRMTSLAVLFYLISLVCFIKGRMAQTGESDSAGQKQRAWPWFTAASASGLLALGTKEIAATLPFMILVYDWIFFRQGRGGWLRRRWPAIIVLAAVLTAAGILYLQFHPQTRAGFFAHYAQLDFTPLQRLFTQFRVVIYYLTLILFPFPHRLALVYDYPLSHTFFDPVTTPLAAMAVMLLVLSAIYAVRRHGLPALAIFWYVGNLVIESTVLPLDIVFEHRTYLPSVLPALVAVHVFTRLLPGAAIQRVCLVLLVLALASGTYIRNRDWRDGVTLLEKTIAHSPGRPQPHNELGTLYLRQGRPDDALARFKTAFQVKPNYAEAFSNAGIALFRMDRRDEARAHFAQALVHDPQSISARFNLGYLLSRKGRLDEAIDQYEMATRLDPGYAKAWAHMGVAWLQQGRLRKAEECFRRVLDLRPGDREATAALEQIGAWRESLQAEAARIREALRADADNPALLFRLGMAYEKSEERDKALQVYGRILDVVHDARPAALRSAIILSESGRANDAVDVLRSMLHRFPEDPGLHYNLACLHARKGDGDKALTRLKQAVALGYDNRERIRTDRDLDSIRNDPGFVGLMAD